jgi:hypothetical protein
MPADTTYSEEKGATVIAPLRSGRRPASAAKLAGVSRAMIYSNRGLRR